LKKTFYSNGKLLLTGEYTVLDGAAALALPTRYGQYLDVQPAKGSFLSWKSLDEDGSAWFEATITLEAITENWQDSKTPETNTLIKILHEAYKANPAVLNTGFSIVTRLTFPRQWGLGTSSTLINNIAQWFGIDAFKLLGASFGGSGYDIACAQNDTPVIYTLKNSLPVIQPVNFHPPFADKLYFVYLNKKQDSKKAIAAYRERRSDINNAVMQIDRLTQTILHTASLHEFCGALETHEKLMSGILGMPTVKEALFSDFNGTLKSLGAWGGDFILAVAEENPEAYFRTKGFGMVVPYDGMILK
jgi:mevalonate kinase